MNYKAILLCVAALIFLVDASLDQERIARHNEVRRELEREATPFLVEGININIPLPRPDVITPPVISNEISIWERLGDYSMVDLVAGLFSVLSLVFGCVYIVWKWNPFIGKKIK